MHDHGLRANGHVACSLSGTNCSVSVQTALCSGALDSLTHIRGGYCIRNVKNENYEFGLPAGDGV